MRKRYPVQEMVKDAVVFRMSAMGDVALTTGVLDYWRRTFGGSFTVITRVDFATLFKNHPAVPRVVGINAKGLDNWFNTCGKLAGEFSHLPLIDLHGNGRAMLLAAMWKGPIARYPKLGFHRRMFRQFRWRWAERPLLAASVPQRYAMALEPVAPEPGELAPKLFLGEDETAKAEGFLRERGLLSGRPLVALHPYATHPNKSWPREKWVALAKALDAAGMDWMVVGRDDAPFLKELSESRDLTNGASLRGSASLLSRADVLVTGDSGPMHLATATGVPVVALFGPTTRHWGFLPSGPKDVVIERELKCRPCSLHGGSACSRGQECLASVEVDEVFRAVKQALGA